MFEREAKDWRELLAWIANDPAVTQRIIQDLGVRDITIRRWVRGESVPRPQNIRRLLGALPEYRERFIELFAEATGDFPEFTLEEPVQQEIPAKFYTQIFQMRGAISQSQSFWKLTNDIIEQALVQLDPENLGMAITVVKCMTSKHYHPGQIFSLQEVVGLGTAPWLGNMEQKALFLGVESLAGYAVATCHPAEVQSYKDDPEALPGHQFELEHSAVAHPILYAGRIAGCLLLSSTEPYYFLSPARQSLVADYTQLISLAFNQQDFLDPACIELRLMPLHRDQKTYFKDFRQRLIKARLKLYNQDDVDDAEHFVWEEIEAEILGLNQPDNR